MSNDISQVWFSNRRARLRKQAQSCPPTGAYDAMGLPMAYHHHHHHHLSHSAAAAAAAAAHQHSSGGPSYMDQFSSSAALAAATASAVSGSSTGSGGSSSVMTGSLTSTASSIYSNQVQAAIGSSLHQTPTVSSPSPYSANSSSALGIIGSGGQQSSSSPASDLSHNHTPASLLSSQVRLLHTLSTVIKM